ncbi:MAG: Ig-like domain-containing protein [Candidatus Wildermuthbacteria bacterium]|nr:Ig-like domain-containing protein [Candidatus Wildermuthbacteria bacterium]
MRITFFAKPLKTVAFLLIVAFSVGTVAPLQSAEAALKTAGPIDPANGYPQWYEDANGIMLSQCLDQNGFCLTEEPDTTQPISFPDNFSEEFFWFVAEAGFDVPGGGVLIDGGGGLIVMAIEGAFGRDEEIVDGNQISFNRLRFRMDVPIAGAYTITHPYGVATVNVTEERLQTTQGIRGINFDTVAVVSDVPVGDIGCELLNQNDICDFGGALAGAIGPFLIREGGIIVDQATGNRYIGNPNQETRVTGSPFGTNFLRIDGPVDSGIGGTDDEGNPIDFIQIDTFALMGKVTGNKPPVISEGITTPPLTKVNTGAVLSVRITDDVGGVQSATIDLTQIGGVAMAPLTLIPPGTALNGTWTFTVDKFDTVGIFELPVKAVDEAGNEGTGTISVTVAEAAPPAEVKDLQALPNSSTAIALSWTAPGDDGSEGTASSYDIRFSATEIKNDADFENALPISANIPAPSAAGATETMTITELDPGTTYFFAIKVSDEVENISLLSNIAFATTLNALALAEITVDPATKTLISDQTQQFTAAGIDQFGNPFETEFSWESSDPAVGAIDPATGMFTAKKAGTTTISATSGSAIGTAKVEVTEATANAITGVTLTVPGEWTLFSAPAQLASIQITEADIDAIITFDSATQQFSQVFSPSSPELLNPLNAFYIKPNKATAITFTLAEQTDPGLASRELANGWNLVSTAMPGLAKDEFSSIQVTLEHSGMVTLFVPQLFNARKDTFADWGADANKELNANPIIDLPAKTVSPLDGYWVNMNGPDTYSKLIF